MTSLAPGARYDLTVAQVAADAGVAPSAVRFYEQHGVIAAERTPANQRRFNAAAACRITVAKLAQRIGLTVQEIADLFAALPDDPEPDDWARVAQSLTDEAHRRTAALTKELEAIAGGARLCEIGREQPVE